MMIRFQQWQPLDSLRRSFRPATLAAVSAALACACALLIPTTGESSPADDSGASGRWTPAGAGLPADQSYDLVSLAFTTNANDTDAPTRTYAAIDAVAPAPDRKSPGPRDGIYVLNRSSDRWQPVAPPVNKYGVRPILAVGSAIYTVNHSGDRLYRLRATAMAASNQTAQERNDQGNGFPEANLAWQDLGPIAPKLRGADGDCRKFQLAVAHGGRLYCAGGKHSGRVFAYNPATGEWSEPVAQTLPKAPQGIGALAVTASGEVYVSLRNQRADQNAIFRGTPGQSRWDRVPFGVPANDPEYKRYLKDYVNATGNKPGPAKLLGAIDNTVFASTQQGVFTLNPDRRSKARWLPRVYMWYKGGGFVAGGSFFSQYERKQTKRWLDTDRFQSVPSVLKGACVRASRIYSPNGQLLYASAKQMRSRRDAKGRVKCEKTVAKRTGLLRLQISPNAPVSSLNLEPRQAHLLARAEKFAGHTLLASGESLLLDAHGRLMRTSNRLRLVRDLRGLFGNSAGESLRFHELTAVSGPAHKSQSRVERFALATSRGVAVIDASGQVIWKAESAPVQRVALAHDGRVVALSAKTVRVYSAQGQETASVTLKRSYVTDVELSPQHNRVYVVGFDNKRNRNPVQVAYLEARSLQDLKFQRKLWSFPAKTLDADMADTRLYNVVLGANGDLYVSGESAGGNTIFRWNGRDLKTQSLVITDLYNHGWALKSAHILYYAQLDPRTLDLRRGQLAIPRLVSKKNLGNTFRAKNGGLAVDSAGTVYLAGASACCIPNGRLLKVAGQRTGERYAGGAVLLIVSPDFRERRLWTTFGGGALHTVAARRIGPRVRFAVSGTPHADPAKRARHPLAETGQLAVDDLPEVGGAKQVPAYFATAELDSGP